MPYDRSGDTWDIINPLIELAQEMTSVKIWGQTIQWGICWEGYLNTNYYAQGTNAAAIFSTGSGLSLIDAVLSITEDHFPETDETYQFGVNGPVDDWLNTTFAIGVKYVNGLAFCYCQIGITGIDWSGGFDSSFNSCISVLQYNHNYNGFDPANITDNDRLMQTAYFCTTSVTDDGTRRPSTPESAVMVWQLGTQRNTNRLTEYDYFLLNEGEMIDTTPLLDPPLKVYIKVPIADNDYPENSALYYYPVSPIPGWKFPADLAEDINDWYDEEIEEDQIGGDGEFDLGSDSIGIAPKPQRGIMDTGMVTLYLPEPLEVKAFANEMWTDNASIAAAFGAMVSSPIDAVVSFGLLPLNLSAARQSAVQVKMGSYTMTSTMAPCNPDYEFFLFDCGTIKVPGKWNMALDYAPYTTFQVYLPYVGFVDVDPSDIVKKYISVYYYINLFTGDFVAHIDSTHTDPSTGAKFTSPIGQYTGNMMFKMPITAMDFSAYYKNQHDTFVSAMSNFASGNVFGGIVDSISFAAGSAQPAGQVKRSGDFSGSTAIMAYNQPFIIRKVPHQVFQGSKGDSLGFDKYVGFPSYKVLKLSSGMGFCKVSDIILDDFVLTDEEEKELRAILKEGVYL